MRLSVRHTLAFSLGSPARAVHHLLLTPLPTAQQKVERWSVEMPGMAEAAMFRDGFGNCAHLVTQLRPTDPIEVAVSGVVQTVDRSGVLGRLDHEPVPAVFRRKSELAAPLMGLTETLAEAGGRIPLLHELMDRVHERQGEQSQSQSQATQPQSQAQQMTVADAVHAFIGSARDLDIPARYVTGYLLDEGNARFHTWAEAWDDGLGWIGFDPVLNVCPASEHIRLATGLDAAGAVPIRTVPVWEEPPVENVQIEVLQEPST